MKKLLLSVFALCFSNAIFSQATLIDENFDSYQDFVISGFGSWLTLDVDQLSTYTGGNPDPTWANAGAAMAFQIFNPTAAAVTNDATGASGELRNFDPHSGTKYAAAWASPPSTTGGATSNEDWLISPAMTLGSSGNSLSFWVKSMSSSYGLEKYKVGIFTGSGTPTASSNFTIISGRTSLSAPYPNWEQKTYSLDSYAGQTVRIGIQCVSADAYMLMVDDFKVTSATLSVNDLDQVRFFISENPTRGKVSISSKEKIAGIRVYDSVGRLVAENKNSNTIDISNNTAGVYYVNFALENGELKTEKIIKE